MDEEIMEFVNINGEKIKECGFRKPAKCKDITIKDKTIADIIIENGGKIFFGGLHSDKTFNLGDDKE